MDGLVGYWHEDGLVIAGGSDLMKWLNGRCLTVSMIDSQVLLCVAGTEGRHCVFAGVRDGHDCHVRTGVQFNLPRFGLSPAVLEMLDDESFTIDLPEEMDLAWPKLYADATTYDPQQEARRVLTSRLTALMASGQTSFKTSQKPPQSFMSLLPRGAWGECLKAAQRASGRLSDEQRWKDAVGA